MALGSILQYPELVQEFELSPEHFQDELASRVVQEVPRYGSGAELDLAIADTRLAEFRSVSINLEQARNWTRKLVEFSIARELDRELSRLPAIDYGEEPGAERLHKLRQLLEGYEKRETNVSLPTMGTLVSKFLDGKQQEIATGKSYAIQVGLSLFDNALGGLQPGEVTLIVGEGGCGKTTLLQYLMRKAAMSGNRSLMASGEMTENQLGDRESRVILGKSPADPWMNLKEVQLALDLREIHEEFLDKISIDTNPDIYLDSLEAKTRKMIATTGCTLLGVDHIDHVKFRGQPLTDFERSSAAIKGIKNMVKRLLVHGIVLGHINREGEKSGSHPTKAWLRGGTHMGQVPDNVIVLLRDLAKGSNKIAAWILKARQTGVTGRFWLNYNLEHGVYSG